MLVILSLFSYAMSHFFLMLFIYLFIVHRYSELITGAICFFSFFALNMLDLFKLIFFPDSGLCYVVVTILQYNNKNDAGDILRIFIKRMWKKADKGKTAVKKYRNQAELPAVFLLAFFLEVSLKIGITR